MKKKFCSITVKYILSVMSIVLLFTVLVSTIWSFMYKSQVWSSAADLVNEMIYSSNTAFDKTLLDINYSITVLNSNNGFRDILENTGERTNAEILEDRRSMENLLGTAVSNKVALKEISVIRPDGTYYKTGSFEKTEDELDVYRKLLDKRATNIAYLAESKRYEKSNVDMLMVKRINADKMTEALVLTTIDCSALWKEYEEHLRMEFGFAVYDRQTGTLVRERALDRFDYVNDVDWDRDISEKEGVYSVETFHDQEYMAMYYESSLTGWITAIYIPSSELTKQYFNGTYLNYLIIAVTMLVATVVSLIVVRALTGDLKRLTNVVKNLDSATLEISEQSYRNDEVGILFDKFREMVERVRHQMGMIKKKEEEMRFFEIKALQAQINPHFFHNSLSTIKYLAEVQGAENIVDVTDSLAQIMRVNMLEDRYISFREEKKYLDSYIKMKEYQYAREINYTLEIEEGLEDLKIMKLLIQPLIENSLKHGCIMDKSEGYINVRIYRDEDGIVVLVRDNGKGMTNERIFEVMQRAGEDQSIGVFNVAERIRLNYGEPFGMDISSEPGYYTVIVLKLPALKGRERTIYDTGDAGR